MMGTKVGCTGREMSENAWSLGQDLSISPEFSGQGTHMQRAEQGGGLGSGKPLA